MNPLISVIVPIYNVQDYLETCINSIVKQTYENLEIILIDDGSPDECPSIIELWKDKDNRIRTIHKKNGGLSSARNAGMDIAKGEYITFIDSDDWIEPTFIEKLFDTIIKYDADVCVVGFKRIYSKEKSVPSAFFINNATVYCSPTNQAVKYFYENAIAVWAKLYRRTIIGETKFIEGRLAEDTPFQTAILQKTSEIAFCNLHLYNYRQRCGSIARTIKPKYLFDHIKSVSEALSASESSFPFEVQYCRSWLASLLYEYTAVKSFSNEIEDSDSTIKHAFIQCGGKEEILKVILFPESIIYYTFSTFGDIATQEEKKKIQNDYRSVFPSIASRKNIFSFLFKYFPCYINIQGVQIIRRIIEKQ